MSWKLGDQDFKGHITGEIQKGHFSKCNSLDFGRNPESYVSIRNVMMYQVELCLYW